MRDGSGLPVPARVVLAREGRSFDPVIRGGDLGWRARRQDFVIAPGERSAYVAADSELAIPPGPSTLTILRGHAHAVLDLDLRAGETRALEVVLRRPGESGWACGDLHLHVARLDPDERALDALLDAEDLDVAALVDWSGRDEGRFGPGWGGWQWTPALLALEHRTARHLTFSAQGWGPHDRACRLALYGHRTPIDARAPPSAFVPGAIAEGAIVTGAMGRISIAGALLGHVVAFEALSHGDMGRTDLWYDLLSAGARLAAIAGTDVQSSSLPETIVDYHGPPGASRVCADLRGAPLDRRSFLDAIAGGRTVVTTGPWIGIRAEDRAPGDTLALDAPRTIRIAVRAAAPIALATGTLRVIANGETVRELPAGTREDAFDLAIEQSTWIAARLDADDRIPGGDRALAHTSPIYVTVAGAAIHEPAAALRVRARLDEEDDPAWTAAARVLLDAR